MFANTTTAKATSVLLTVGPICAVAYILGMLSFATLFVVYVW
jgi:hypothetical protein